MSASLRKILEDLIVKMSRMESLIALLTDRCNNLDDKIEGRAGEQFSTYMKKLDTACTMFDLKIDQQTQQLDISLNDIRENITWSARKIREIENNIYIEKESNSSSEKLEIIRTLFGDDDD